MAEASKDFKLAGFKVLGFLAQQLVSNRCQTRPCISPRCLLNHVLTVGSARLVVDLLVIAFET